MQTSDCMTVDKQAAVQMQDMWLYVPMKVAISQICSLLWPLESQVSRILQRLCRGSILTLYQIQVSPTFPLD